jgi:hypothetical protein
MTDRIFPATLAMGGALLIGEAAADANAWLPAITSLSTGAILTWYLYYQTTVVGKENRDHVERIISSGSDATEKLTESFKEEQREQRRCFEDSCKQITSNFREELSRLPCRTPPHNN